MVNEIQSNEDKLDLPKDCLLLYEDTEEKCVWLTIELSLSKSDSLSENVEDIEPNEIERLPPSRDLQVSSACHLHATAPMPWALEEILVPACKQRSVSTT